MNWIIKYTAGARRDLKAINSYITYNLCAPKAAARKIDRIIKKIQALKNMPMMYKVYDEEPWKSQQLRYFSVDNYYVFYLIEEESKEVNIIRIIYSGRDINRQLENSL